MNTTLTDRNKKVLYFILLAVIALMAIKTIIIPSIDKYSEARQVKSSLVAQKENMVAEMGKIDSYKSLLAVANSEYKKSAEKVFNNSKPSGIDEAITNKVIEMGLTPLSLQITDINRVKLVPYAVPKANPQMSGSAQNNEQEVASGVIADDKSLITAANVQFVASGSVENVRAMAASMSDSEGIHVQSLTLTLAGDSSILNATISMVLSDSVE
ncbi:MAG: hypothetical protein RR911_03265 [Oscillospiraceae bacterium]